MSELNKDSNKNIKITDIGLGRRLRESAEAATRQALCAHVSAGRTIPVLEDGKVVYKRLLLTPDDG